MMVYWQLKIAQFFSFLLNLRKMKYQNFILLIIEEHALEPNAIKQLY